MITQIQIGPSVYEAFSWLFIQDNLQKVPQILRQKRKENQGKSKKKSCFSYQKAIEHYETTHIEKKNTNLSA